LITPTYAAQYHPALPDQRTLRFTPNAAGGYDVSLMPFHFESDLGANLHLLDRRAFEAWGSRRYEAQLNFAFPFYGKTYDRMYANEDGAIALGHDLVSYFSYSYHYGGDTPFIFPLLVDLNPEAGGSVFARQESDRLILTWERVPAWYHREDVYTFQAVLYTSGVFEFSYNGLPDKLAYLSDDEPSARAWVIGAVPGDMKISPLAPLPAASLSSKPVVACPGGQARGNLPAESPARTAQPGRAEKAPQGLVRAPAACPEPAEGGAFQLQTGGLQPLGLSWQWPQRIELAALTPEHVIRGGPEGLVQDYYLDFRRHLHTLLLPLAYLMLGVSLLMLLAFPWLFHLNLVKPLETLLAGVRRVNAGDLQTTMPVHYRDEIGFLTESFNRAAARLHDQVTTLETRVAERTADLTQVNARLRQEMDQREAAQAQVLAQQRAGRGA
jgi:HAMP domain-containing protein